MFEHVVLLLKIVEALLSFPNNAPLFVDGSLHVGFIEYHR